MDNLTSKQELAEAWELLESLMDYAYEKGFHECGYNPAKLIADEMERLKKLLATRWMDRAKLSAELSALEPSAEREIWACVSNGISPPYVRFFESLEEMKAYGWRNHDISPNFYKIRTPQPPTANIETAVRGWIERRRKELSKSGITGGHYVADLCLLEEVLDDCLRGAAETKSERIKAMADDLLSRVVHAPQAPDETSADLWKCDTCGRQSDRAHVTCPFVKCTGILRPPSESDATR